MLGYLLSTLSKRSWLRITARSMSSTGNALTITPASLQELATRSLPGHLSILDVTWRMPNSQRVAKTDFTVKHIPGAQFLDLDEVASPHELGLKHMMPPERLFADACENFGIRPDTHVVMYDTHGVFSAPRALFMFRAFGHVNSSILDGGLPRWEAEGLPVQSGAPAAVERTVYPTPSLDEATIRSYQQMVANSQLSNSVAELVLDARPRGRFLGTEPEPRPGLSSGHIPNSFSLPFNLFLQSNTIPGTSATYTTYLPPPAVRQALVDAVGSENAELIIKGDKPVITTCGSGMTAAVLWLGLWQLGAEKISLYDESWAGYAARKESDIIKNT